MSSDPLFPTSFDLDNEIKRYEFNEYIERNKRGIVLDKEVPNDDEYYEDDLLYTNAIRDDIIGDKIDKSRYIQDKITYINIKSNYLQNNYDKNIFADESLYSTGNIFRTSYEFFVFKSLNISIMDNMIYFRLNDKNTGENLINLSTNQDIFYISLDVNHNYSILELQNTLNQRINNFIVNNCGPQLNNAVDPDNIINITCVRNDDILDPNIIIVTMDTESPFEFQCQFSIENSSNSSNPSNASNPSNHFNTTLKKQSNEYNIVLDTPIQNVKSIRVVSSNIINSDTIITEDNNIVNYSLSDNIPDNTYYWTSIIPVGDYDINELLTFLINDMNLTIFHDLNITNYFTFNYDNITGIITISRSAISTFEFVIDFMYVEKIKWRNLLTMLGFKKNITQYTNSITNSIINGRKIHNNTEYLINYIPYIMPNLKKPNSIWININDYETLFDLEINKWFFNKFCFFNNDKDGEFQPITTIFENPIKLSYLKISLFDELGLIYNVNNTDHWFILEIIYQGDRLYGANIDSRRDQFAGAHVTQKVI